jgi:hypothetical protein
VECCPCDKPSDQEHYKQHDKDEITNQPQLILRLQEIDDACCKSLQLSLSLDGDQAAPDPDRNSFRSGRGI